jgi:hypothetical protein
MRARHLGALIAEQDHELVAAPAEGLILVADGRLQQVADVAQDLVAHQVPVAVVDVLEIVHVADHHHAFEPRGSSTRRASAAWFNRPVSRSRSIVCLRSRRR